MIIRRKMTKTMLNSKINLKNSVCNIISFLYILIYSVDRCSFWAVYVVADKGRLIVCCSSYSTFSLLTDVCSISYIQRFYLSYHETTRT